MTAGCDRDPVAWLFRNADGSTRFILDDPKRVAAWRSAHEGEIIPLYVALTDAEREAIAYAELTLRCETHPVCERHMGVLRRLLERTK